MSKKQLEKCTDKLFEALELMEGRTQDDAIDFVNAFEEAYAKTIAIVVCSMISSGQEPKNGKDFFDCCMKDVEGSAKELCVHGLEAFSLKNPWSTETTNEKTLREILADIGITDINLIENPDADPTAD